MRFGLALAASALIATSAQAVTVVNGSFENGVALPAGQRFLPAPPNDTTSIPGWTILSSGIDYVNNTVWNASQGRRSIELAGIGSGGITTRITNQFIPGRQYRLVWDMSVNPFAPNSTYQVTVSATGGGAQFFSYVKSATNLPTPTNMLYQTYTYFWTPGGTSSNIQFRSRSTRSVGVVIDNVRISLVPEPADWMLLITGFAMTGFAMRRRRASAVAA
jgi:hypothetical protein